MSYDIYLRDPVSGETLQTDQPHQIRGGMYAVGGTREMWLSVTYNYAYWYYKPGVFAATEIYGMSGAQSIPVLKEAIKALESMIEDISDEERRECEEQGATGYWMPTRQNAIKPLYKLLAFAQMRPDGTWDGD